MTTLRIAVIGCGYWGPNHVRTFVEMVHALIRQSKVLLGGLERTETSVVVTEVEVERRIEPDNSETRVVLFEAAIAAANGLTFEQALGTVTIEAARILGVDTRVGSLEAGKDGDLALFDGDPFEYTSHVTGVVIDGRVVSDTAH